MLFSAQREFVYLVSWCFKPRENNKMKGGKKKKKSAAFSDAWNLLPVYAGLKSPGLQFTFSSSNNAVFIWKPFFFFNRLALYLNHRLALKIQVRDLYRCPLVSVPAKAILVMTVLAVHGRHTSLPLLPISGIHCF